MGSSYQNVWHHKSSMFWYVSPGSTYCISIITYRYLVLYMSFDKFLLAVESRDLSQADKNIIRVSSFSILQNFDFWMIKFTVIPKKILGTCQFDVLVNFIIQKIARLKSNQFSQFFWWEVNLRRLRAFILQKVQASVV